MQTEYRIRSNFIRKCAKAQGMNQSALADRIGTASGHLGRWLNGTVTPSMSAVASIADALSLPVDMLVERVDSDGVRETHMIYGMDRARRIPNVGYIGAGSEDFDLPLFTDGDTPAGEGVLGYENFPSEDPNAFIVTVAGNSMTPVYPEGTRVLIEPHLGFRRNHVHLIRDAEKATYLKRVQWDGINYILESFNSAQYPPIYRKPEEIAEHPSYGLFLWRATWFKPKE